MIPLACYAVNPETGRIGLILAEYSGGRAVSRVWTGEEYPKTKAGARAAAAECERRNRETRDARR